MRISTLVVARLIRYLSTCVFLFACSGVAPAQDAADTIFAVARQKIQRQDITKSVQLGTGNNRIAFSDMPAQGGVLIGFDVQLSKFIDHEIVHAIKPLYATEAGDIATTEFGDFGTKPGKKKNPNLTRTLRLKAPPGFAVAGISVRNRLFIDGLKLTFNPIKGQGLDTAQVAVSNWIGNDTHGNSEKTLGNNGMPIVGIFGNRDEQRVLALGIFQVSAPAVASGKIAKPLPPKADVENPDAPNVKPAEDARAKAEDAAKNDLAAEKAEPNLVVKEPTESHLSWLPAVMFGVVCMLVFAGCWLVMGGKRNEKTQANSGRRPVVVNKGQRGTPPPIPTDDGPKESREAKPRTMPPALPAEPKAIPGAITVSEKSSKPEPLLNSAFTEKAPTHAPASQTFDDAFGEMPSIARTQPPYFHARAVFALKTNRFYRVYVMPEVLLFLDAGPESKDGFTKGAVAAGAVTGGLLGAVVGAAIGSIIDNARQDSAQTRKEALDRADTDELMRLSGDGAPNFRVALEDLHDARIEPTSMWHSMQYFGNQYIGLFRFRHPDHGEMTLEIPTVNDMKTALEELPQAFGDYLDVKVAFDRESWQYVAKQ